LCLPLPSPFCGTGAAVVLAGRTVADILGGRRVCFSAFLSLRVLPVPCSVCRDGDFLGRWARQRLTAAAAALPKAALPRCPSFPLPASRCGSTHRCLRLPPRRSCGLPLLPLAAVGRTCRDAAACRCLLPYRCCWSPTLGIHLPFLPSSLPLLPCPH
jgi:hypothetical protein